MKRILFILLIVPEIFLPKLSHASVTCGVDKIPVAGCIYRNDNDPTYLIIGIEDGLTVDDKDADYANPIKPECVKPQGGFLGIGGAKPSLKNSFFWGDLDAHMVSIYGRYEGIKERRTAYLRQFDLRKINYEDHRKLDVSNEKEVKELTGSCRVGLGLKRNY
jgi:hypothetical protein